MRLEDQGTGVLSWRLRGNLGALPIDVDFVSEYKLNLLTGRIEEHRWGTHDGMMPGALLSSEGG